jgi:hypothetical protein
VHEPHAVGVYCYSSLLDAAICTGLKKLMKFQKVKQSWIVENLYAVRQKAENFVEDNLLELGI